MSFSIAEVGQELAVGFVENFALETHEHSLSTPRYPAASHAGSEYFGNDYHQKMAYVAALTGDWRGWIIPYAGWQRQQTGGRAHESGLQRHQAARLGQDRPQTGQ